MIIIIIIILIILIATRKLEQGDCGMTFEAPPEPFT